MRRVVPGPQEVPSPATVAAWLVLDRLPSEQVPRWAAHWLADGADGPALRELAGLGANDLAQVRALLPDAVAEAGTTLPDEAAAAGWLLLDDVARLYLDGRADVQWVAEQVSRVLEAAGWAPALDEHPLGQLQGLEDELVGTWGRSRAELELVVTEACSRVAREPDRPRADAWTLVQVRTVARVSVAWLREEVERLSGAPTTVVEATGRRTLLLVAGRVQRDTLTVLDVRLASLRVKALADQADTVPPREWAER